jgi:retron-type reverse transcriptase
MVVGYEKHKLFDIDAKDESPASWYQRRQARRHQKIRKEKFRLEPGTLPNLAYIANVDFLLFVFDQMRREGGQAPGLDGLHYADFSRGEIAAAFRKIAKSILNGTYRPYEYRSVFLDKGDGTQRELRLRNIVDRVVAGAIYRALLAYFEPEFSPYSYGFRAAPDAWMEPAEQRRTWNTWALLADLEQIVVSEHRFVLAIDDVRKAFDNVDIDLVLSILGNHISDNATLYLISRVLRGGDDAKEIGIDQGSPLSPLILNVLMDRVHDGPLSKNQTVQFRYADNLTYPCETIDEGNRTLTQVRELLQEANLTLKGKDGVTDLREKEAQLLGFSISVNEGKLCLKPGSKTWKKLEEGLLKAHEARDPTNTARQVMIGWIQALGPTFGTMKKEGMLDRLLQIAQEFGFREGITHEELESEWKKTWCRWKSVRKDAVLRYKAFNPLTTKPATTLRMLRNRQPARRPAQRRRPRAPDTPGEWGSTHYAIGPVITAKTSIRRTNDHQYRR